MPINENQKNKNNILKRFGLVYVLPVLVGLSIILLTYYITDKFELDNTEKIPGIIIGLAITMALYLKNRLKWLALPDGSYINKRELLDDVKEITYQKSSAVEPSTYAASFHFSVISKFMLVLAGLLAIIGGIYIYSSSRFLFPTLIVIGGIFLWYLAYKEIADAGPKLKLAKEGLWTKKLGFTPWKSIRKTAVVTENGGRSSQTYLDIYLRDSQLGIMPDDRLSLNDIDDHEKIKKMIDELSRSL